jgi:two-component system, NtrC family, sensor kinase
VTLSRKGAKSRRRITSLRSKTTKAKTHIDRVRAANADLKKRLAKALEQQAATSKVLQAIASTPDDLEPVFDEMLDNAVRICEGKFGVLMMFEAGGFRHVTLHGTTQAYAEAMQREPVFYPSAGHPLDRLAKTKRVVHVADMRAERRMPGRLVRLAGARTLLLVPMLSKNGMVGAIGIYRQEVRPFTDKQIDLLKSFANQAVIAIENTRLLNELRESLQQQTATSEVLQVISSSPGELEPVFQAMLASATRICEAKFGTLLLLEEDQLRLVAMHGAPREFEELRPSAPEALSP